MRPRFLQVKSTQKIDDEEEEKDLKEEMLDDFANDPDVRSALFPHFMFHFLIVLF